MNEAAVAQVVEWANAVCAAHRLDGWTGARRLLEQLKREHGFDELGMELAASYPGVDSDAVCSVLLDMRHPIVPRMPGPDMEKL